MEQESAVRGEERCSRQREQRAGDLRLGAFSEGEGLCGPEAIEGGGPAEDWVLENDHKIGSRGLTVKHTPRFPRLSPWFGSS